MEKLLDIKDIHAEVEGKQILKGLDLCVNPGEVHVIMGPNGAGKSTLANVIFNNAAYTKTSGEITFDGEDITDMDTHKIAQMGVFMSFQNPVEIPGITTFNFIKYAKGKKENKMIRTLQLKKDLEGFADELQMDKALISRNLNEGFSGGEKKKNEILQMLSLDPKLAILDETDSGLDFDAVRIVSKGINMFMSDEHALIIITHNLKMLESIQVDYVHILVDGRIVKTGNAELSKEIAEKGFAQYKE